MSMVKAVSRQPTFVATVAAAACGFVIAAATLLSSPARAQERVYEQIIARKNPTADVRIAYGKEPQQFGELWLPKGANKSPLIVMVHGGCWLAELPSYDLLNQAADALRARGYAVWNIEYRRVGETGGGYPGTFLDVAHAADFVRELAKKYPLDLTHIVSIGHSAGGPLAMWLTARRKLPATSALFMSEPIAIEAVVNLGGVGDLKHLEPFSPPVCGTDTIDHLVGRRARNVANPFADTSPSELLPLGSKQVMVYGVFDAAIPPFFGKHYQELAAAKGEKVELVIIPDAAHFDIIATWTPAWNTILAVVDRLFGKSE
jgi:acetyl esterase/lipase